MFPEKGEFLALDLGGSKFKVLQVKVSENGKRNVKMESETYPIPKEVFSGRSTEVRDMPTCQKGISSPLLSEKLCVIVWGTYCTHLACFQFFEPARAL